MLLLLLWSHLWWASVLRWLLMLLHLILLWHRRSIWLRSLALSLWSLTLVHLLLLVNLLLSWTWSLLISVVVLILLGLASLLLLNTLSLILDSDLLSDERLLWFLEHLLHLSFGIEDSVFQIGGFSAGDGWSLEIFHSDERLLFRVEEFSKVGNNQVDIFSWLGLRTSCFKKNCLLEQMEECFVLVNSLLSNLEKSSLLP